MKRSLLIFVAVGSCAACSKKHTPAPTQVTTLAGNGTAGKANGPALQSSFNFPYGLTLDVKKGILRMRKRNANCRIACWQF